MMEANLQMLLLQLPVAVDLDIRWSPSTAGYEERGSPTCWPFRLSGFDNKVGPSLAMLQDPPIGYRFHGCFLSGYRTNGRVRREGRECGVAGTPERCCVDEHNLPITVQLLRAVWEGATSPGLLLGDLDMRTNHGEFSGA